MWSSTQPSRRKHRGPSFRLKNTREPHTAGLEAQGTRRDAHTTPRASLSFPATAPRRVVHSMVGGWPARGATQGAAQIRLNGSKCGLGAGTALYVGKGGPGVSSSPRCWATLGKSPNLSGPPPPPLYGKRGGPPQMPCKVRGKAQTPGLSCSMG